MPSSTFRKAKTPKKRKTAKRASDPLNSLLHGTVKAAMSDLEKQRLEQALLESERRYRSLVHATAQVVWITGRDGFVTEDLPTWREFTGQTAEQVKGHGWMEALHPGDVANVRAVWSQSLASSQPHVNEFRVRRADGLYRLMRAHAVPIVNNAGEVQEWIGTCADITDQREAEEKQKFLYRASEVLSTSLEYEKTLQTVADLIVPHLAEWCTIHIQEEDGGIKQVALAHADPAMVEFALELNRKYPPNYEGPMGLKTLLREKRSLLIAEITDEMLVQGARDEEHLRISRGLKLSSVMGVPLIMHGKALGYISLFTTEGRKYDEDDVEFAQTLASRAAVAVENARLYRDLEEKVTRRTSELQKAQQQDRANFQRLQFIIRNLPLAAIAIDERDTILEMNPLFPMMLGIDHKPENMIGKKRRDFAREWKKNVVDSDVHIQKLNETLSSGQPLIGQEVPMKDGRILLRDCVPIVEDGKHFGYLIVYRDVTQERRIDATKSEFMSLASHQLRTPLTAIRWIFGRLHKNLAGKLGPTEQHLLEDGRMAAMRMSQTINTMLQISRIQAGQVQLSCRSVAMREFLQDLMETYRDESEAKKQATTLQCDSGLAVYTDPQLLHEVLCNLLSNAIKYTPEKGAIRLCVSQRGNTMEITVQDSGYGIPRHQQAKVFRKFFRGDNVVSRDPNGTGLGLHMVSLITELLGGTIDFESEEGRGTTFQLVLPAAQ